MSENKVVIKINYDKDRKRVSAAAPKMITVWHTRRLSAAAAVLMLLVLTPVFWFGGKEAGDAVDSEKTEYAKNQPGLKTSIESTKSDTVNVNGAKSPRSKPGDKAINVESGRPAAIIYTKKVVRASLNSGSKDSEPYLPAKLPVRLSPTQKIELFYFTELKNINAKLMYHVWAKDGRVFEKKQLAIRGGEGGVLSSRTLSYKDRGEWRVQLVDGKGRVFSEVNFSVNPG